MKNLIIDEGNSFTKVAVYENGAQLWYERFERGSFEEGLRQAINCSEIGACIVASVVDGAEDRFFFLRREVGRVYFVSNAMPMPFTNRYATPETLGVDRLAVMAAAVRRFPKRNVLVIDAGTCITFDVMTSGGDYLGGAIAPGLAMRLRAMHEFTAKLPQVAEQDFDITHFIGDTTVGCMLSGVYHNVVCEIDGVVERYRERFGDLVVVLTGGNYFYLEKRIKSCNFASSFFLLEGLNVILEHQEQGEGRY